MIKINLSRKLGEVRWSQATLAKVTQIRPSTINLMFREMTDRVNLVYLDRICEALDCDLFDILEYIPNEHSEQKPMFTYGDNLKV